MALEMPQDQRQFRDWILSFLNAAEPATIVDLGCGGCADLSAIAAHYRHPDTRLIGIDTSPKAIERAVERCAADPRISFEQSRLGDRLPFADSSLDVVYSKDLLECLADREAFVREVARILRPGGLAVLAHWDWDTQQFDGHDKALVRRIVHAFADWQQAWMDHSDGWMGRRLWGTVQTTGLFEGAIHAYVMTNTTYAAPLFGYARVQDFGALVRHERITAGEYDQFLADQEGLSQQGRYFYSITGYVYVGRRLATARP